MSAATWSARAMSTGSTRKQDTVPLEVQEHPSRRDVHDDRAVQEHRARLVEADDREGLLPDLKLATDLAGPARGGGELGAVFVLMTTCGLP